MAVEGGGIGARLRAGREKLGLTVLQVAERIHTDPRIVDAIEAENFEALGAPVYARGHIRHYADLVAEPANELVQIYSNLAKVAQPDLTRIVKAPAGPDSSKLVAPALVVVAVFAVAGAIWWISALSKKKPQMSDTHVVTDETSAAASAPPAESSGASEGAPASGATASAPTTDSSVSGAPGATSRGVSANAGSSPAARSTGAAGSTGSPPPAARSNTAAGGSTAAAGTATRSPSAGQATRAASSNTAPTSTASSASLPTRTASSTPSAAAAPPTRTGTSAPPAAAGPPTRSAAAATPEAAAPRPKNQSSVTLRYSADSWTEVYDASGARLFYDVGAANSVQTVVGTPPLRVVLGNAAGVSVEYNGHSKAIAKLSRPDGSVQFSITRSGEVVRAKPVADGG
jgi:cytoskeleton protein RodZ